MKVFGRDVHGCVTWLVGSFLPLSLERATTSYSTSFPDVVVINIIFDILEVTLLETIDLKILLRCLTLMKLGCP